MKHLPLAILGLGIAEVATAKAIKRRRKIVNDLIFAFQLILVKFRFFLYLFRWFAYSSDLGKMSPLNIRISLSIA
jgi:hypothetical protein